MLTLIICSRNKFISEELKQNIQITIGIEFELIVIDNSLNSYSIFSAYNEGILRARFPYLCFMHEDILYQTQDWGLKIIHHFKDEEVGLIGVLGTHFMPQSPSGWIQPNVKSGQISQGQRNNEGWEVLSHFRELSRFNNGETLIEAVAVDGVCMFIRKDLFEQIKFDEELFKGFNCYDLDICFQIRQIGKKVCIINDLEIVHFSYGSLDQSWVDATLLFFEKWKKILPQIAGTVILEQEQDIRSFFVDNIFEMIQENNKLNNELLSIHNSVSYKLGRAILNPISFIHRKLHK